MTQSQPLMKVAGSGELDVSAERRRARILSRILESNQSLQGIHDVSEIQRMLIDITKDLFAGSAVLLNSTIQPKVDDNHYVVHSDFTGSEREFAERLANEVAASGLPSFSAEFEVASDQIASCVPVCFEQQCYGAMYVTLPEDSLGSSDELALYLRMLGTQAGIALNVSLSVRRLGEQMSVLSADAGIDFAKDEVPLTVAKRAFERWLIRARLTETRGNIAAAARVLKMDRGQLSRLVKRHDIDAASFRS